GARQRVVLTTELPGRVAPSLVAEIRPRVNGLSQQRLFEEVAQRSLLASKQGLVAVRLAEQVDAVTLYQAIGGGAR
ncbi:MAG: hypothetical protein FJ265_16025, partial [Planctomycetes bacterium]|nr:hypothetical protein [Planctomycetota bacterium]